MHPADSPSGSLREKGVHGATDPTVWGSRLFPETLNEAHGWGVEPGGGVRTIVAGVRIVSLADGSMQAAADRLPATPARVVTLPERLGGGFLFAHDARLWRAPGWLESAAPLLTMASTIENVLIGLDRVYVRSVQGNLVGLDPVTWTLVGLGPLPATPNLGRLAAFDGWRAVSVADLRGTLMTFNAGSSWRRLPLPIDPTEVAQQGDVIVVAGLDEGHQQQWWEVRPDGQVAKLVATSPSTPVERGAPAVDATARSFGPHPLVSAVEDGWPLADRTVLVARDGAIARIRLSDGALVDAVADAFPLRPARCHPLALDAGQAGEVAFVCGELRGRTVIYRWDSPSARLVELRRFEGPRQVLGFGTGGLAARGGCDALASGDAVGGLQRWCLAPRGRPWTDAEFPADRMVALLADGRTLLLRPPRGGDLSTVQLRLLEGARGKDIPVVVPLLHADVVQALRAGIWMDGFEERRPGVIGGWVDAAGALLGVEISAGGELRVGEYIRDAGAPVASGRWAFGWTASRRGFESTDGGMTWTKEIALPDPIVPPRTTRERACGPVGCIGFGWLRVGWGATVQPLAPDPPPHAPAPIRSPAGLDLVCEPLEQPPPFAVAMGAPHSAQTAAPAGRASATTVYATSTAGATSAFAPFAGRAGPGMPRDDLGYEAEAVSGLEHAPRTMPLGRVYAWGPRTGEWDQLGRWQVRWQWPWGGWADARSSAVAAAPWPTLDGARRALSGGQGIRTVWTLVAGDDADHALLLARHAAGPPALEIFVLEADAPPVAVRRALGDPFPEVESAVRAGGRWYIATTQSPGELAATVIWSLDGSTAREFARLPRVGFEARPQVWLARQSGPRQSGPSGGPKIGVVVDGEPEEQQRTRMRWVVAVDVESSSIGVPEPLAPADFSDRTVDVCAGEEPGWEVDVPWPDRGTVRLRVGSRWEATLQAPVVRARISPERACVERAHGSLDGYTSAPPQEQQPQQPAPDPTPRNGAQKQARQAPNHPIYVATFFSHSRYSLRCVER